MTVETETVTGDLIIRRVVVGVLDTNCWILRSVATGDGVIIDPGDDPAWILDAVSDTEVSAIVLTHTHFDHVLAVPTVHDALGAPVLVHPSEEPVWPNELRYHDEHGHFDAGTATTQLIGCGCTPTLDATMSVWDGQHTPVEHGHEIRLGPTTLTVLHTPGHTPGSISIHAPQQAQVFTGDTLFPGGPGLTGWPFSDFATIISSIKTMLFRLPGPTIVNPGHGHSTTIAAERPHLASWTLRGWSRWWALDGVRQAQRHRRCGGRHRAPLDQTGPGQRTCHPSTPNQFNRIKTRRRAELIGAPNSAVPNAWVGCLWRGTT